MTLALSRNGFRRVLGVAAAALILVTFGLAQRGRPAPSLGDGPWTYDTYEPGTRIRVSILTRGLSHPWSLAWIPGGEMLVTERDGRLRVVRNGILDPNPVAGVPEVRHGGLNGLMEVLPHPRFAANQFVYLTYSKSADYGVTTALARARLAGGALVDLKEIFVADSRGQGNPGGATRLAFGADGLLYMALGGTGADGDSRAQDPDNHKGKILRFRDDGSVPPDNPFVDKPGFKPEIYSLGHRNQLGLAFHPTTGALWETEQGPQGGDEINVILRGRNYGWPIVSYGHNYDGKPWPAVWRADLEAPFLFWVPSIATSGMAFYTGDAFPAWKDNLFVGGMVEARIPGTGQLQRIVLNGDGELRRESLLRDLRQRIRDVRQGPDGLLYLLTDEDAGVILKIEPAARN
ncbi:MAG TPA: PQQ-dependent sugar dehydrogenase [Terriglobia bacterium]|nr:PQQ-dependent sugar dehydrogenase [Terriglobia bacterium]